MTVELLEQPDLDRAVRVMVAGLEACSTPDQAATYLWETRARLVPRLQVMRRHKRMPGMADYVEQLVAEIDEAFAVAFGSAGVAREEGEPC